VILAIDNDHVIMVEQFRIPLGRRSLELPAGLVGDDDGEGEDPRWPLPANWKRNRLSRGADRIPGGISVLAGHGHRIYTLFHATDLEKIGEGGGLDGEDITVHRVPLAQVDAFIAARRAEGYAIDTRMLLFLELAS
jgi:ADP-ribose pyrophosphatase